MGQKRTRHATFNNRRSPPPFPPRVSTARRRSYIDCTRLRDPRGAFRNRAGWERLPVHMRRESKMTKTIDGTKVPHHGLFYMENAGGLRVEQESPAPIAAEERQPSCFALEDE